MSNNVYQIHYLDDARQKRIVLKKDEQGNQNPYAMIVKDTEEGGYVVHKFESGKVRHKANYAEARRSACRAN